MVFRGHAPIVNVGPSLTAALAAALAAAVQRWPWFQGGAVVSGGCARDVSVWPGAPLALCEPGCCVNRDTHTARICELIFVQASGWRHSAPENGAGRGVNGTGDPALKFGVLG